MADTADLAAVIGAFGHVLHGAGIPVTPERSSRFAEAVLLARPSTNAELRALGRTTLLSSRDQIEVFDAVFDQVFRGLLDRAEFRSDSAAPPVAPPAPPLPDDDTSTAEGEERTEPRQGPVAPTGEQGGEGDEEGEQAALVAVSVEERLGHKDFADCSDDELALLMALVDRFPLLAPMRLARRERRHPAGRSLDVRATLRAAHRTMGDPVHRVHRRRRERPRRVVLLADVSGSMESYSRVYLHLMRGAVKGLGAEAFVFATRLTRLTKQLAHTHPDIAYRRAAEAAPDWAGGTRIGAALKAFVDEHGRRGMARGAVVVIVSDGWEIEDPELVGRAMEQLSRLAFHIVWVNPRKAAAGYQPLVGGMAAALPYVDTFVSGHSLRALAEVLEAIRDAGADGRHHAYAPPVRLPDLAEPAALG